jgi:hypothetical protein
MPSQYLSPMPRPRPSDHVTAFCIWIQQFFKCKNNGTQNFKLKKNWQNFCVQWLRGMENCHFNTCTLVVDSSYKNKDY